MNTYLVGIGATFKPFRTEYNHISCIYAETAQEAYQKAVYIHSAHFVDPLYATYESYPGILKLPKLWFHISEKDAILKEYFNQSQEDSMEDIYDFMYWGDYDKAIQLLADTAIKENWEYPGKRENHILKNYMRYTFFKLQSEDKIYITDDYVLFNTGLFTPLYDPIYVYGEKNKTQCPQNYSEWIFKGYMTEYDLGELGIYELPSRADYFSDPSQLIFDPTLKINVQYDHILNDARNLERIQNIDTKNIQSLLIGEIDKAKKRVAANYQLAIPQYYQNKIQLLLPLCLEDGITPDIALVITRSQNGKYYQGHTCITLDMAYNNARIIAKPENSWLTI